MYKNEYLDKCLKEKEGSFYLLRGYGETLNNKYPKLVIDDLAFIYDKPERLKEFKNELEKAEIKEFVLAERSTGLIKILHALDFVGITIDGIATIKYIDKYVDEEEELQGLRMIVK